MESAVTFIVKATNNKNKILRCMASIARQKNKNYKVIAICSSEGARKQIEKKYPDVLILEIENAAAFAERVDEALALVQTEYFAAVNFDEVLAPNAVNVILSSKKDIVLFNTSHLKGAKFTAWYSLPGKASLAGYMKYGFSIWNNAIKTQIVKDNSISLKSIDYCGQAMFLLRCYSFAESFRVTDNVIAYRENEPKKARITYEQFNENQEIIEAALNSFSKREMLNEKEQLIGDFVLVQLGEAEKEGSMIERMKKKRIIRKMIGI